MKFLRNPEIKKSMIIYGVLVLIAGTVGVLLYPSALCVILLSTVSPIYVHFIITYQRYRRLERLSDEIDCILHGKQEFRLEDYTEGELSILRDELAKLTIRMAEQADALERDKTKLADSIADISHQIRTPLTSVNLVLSLLGEPGLSQERRQTLLREMERLLDKTDWLIRALLKMSRFDAGTAQFCRRTIRAKELIQRSAESLAVSMELREQRFIIDAEESCSLFCDPEWTTEALENIIKNCMEHTPKEGVIRVTARETALFSEIEITDTGHGIDKDDLPHLFERFYKGKNSGAQSVGIGLALARSIIVAQDGTIKASNGHIQGARFVVRLYKQSTAKETGEWKEKDVL